MFQSCLPAPQGSVCLKARTACASPSSFLLQGAILCEAAIAEGEGMSHQVPGMTMAEMSKGESQITWHMATGTMTTASLSSAPGLSMATDL